MGDGVYWVVSGSLSVLDHRGGVLSVTAAGGIIGASPPLLPSCRRAACPLAIATCSRL